MPLQNNVTISTRSIPAERELIAKLSPVGKNQLRQLQELTNDRSTGLFGAVDVDPQIFDSLKEVADETRFRVLHFSDTLSVDGSGNNIEIVAGKTSAVEILGGDGEEFVLPSAWIVSSEQDQ